MKKAILKSIEIEVHADDSSATLNLEQNKINYGVESHNGHSHFDYIVIRAIATIWIPIKTIARYQKPANYKIHRIDSGGLWSIESDADNVFLKRGKENQIEELKNYLEILNVDITDFEKLKNEALA